MQPEITVEIDGPTADSLGPHAPEEVVADGQAATKYTVHMGRFRDGTLVAVGSLTCIGQAGLLHGFATIPGTSTAEDMVEIGDALARRFAILGGGTLSVADEQPIASTTGWERAATTAGTPPWRVRAVATRQVEPKPWDHAAYTIATATAQLERTPRLLRAWVGESGGLWDTWRESPKGWSVLEIVGHLAHAESKLWRPRLQHLVEFGEHPPFEPFDRLGMLHRYATESLDDLIRRFGESRTQSIAALHQLDPDARRLASRARHPEFGIVTMGQLIAAWVSHDLSHLYQVTRILARPFCAAAGPWHQYIRLAASLGT